MGDDVNDRTVTYEINLTVTRPVRIYDHDSTREEIAKWMVSAEARRELERELMLVLRRFDGDCDVEVMAASITTE